MAAGYRGDILTRRCRWKKLLQIIIALLGIVVVLSSARDAEPKEERLREYLMLQLDSLGHHSTTMSALMTTAPGHELRKRFLQARVPYKKLEFIIEYYYPSAATSLNGPTLVEAEPSEPAEAQHPTGFQVLEEMMFEELTTENRLLAKNEVSNIVYQVARVRSYLEVQPLPEAEVFNAIRLNLYRLIAKGISGFDSPVVQNSIPEAIATLNGLRDVLVYFERDEDLMHRINASVVYLDGQRDFNTMNRARFIASHINPLLHSLHQYQKDHQIPFPTEPRAVDPMAKDLFQQNSFNKYLFAPSGTKVSSPEMVALGEQLFFDPLLSGSGSRSCATCHDPAKQFTDGLPVNESLFGNKPLLRNTPTLINAALQPVQFADSRIAFLEDQVHAVVSNEAEMGGDFRQILKKLSKAQKYETSVPAALGYRQDQLTAGDIKASLAAYVRSLVSLDSRFDKYMRGDLTAMTGEEVTGFNLFMGKAKCGTCHFVPLFSGAVPPLFDKMESEVLGVPATTDTINARIDADSGKYHLYKMQHQLHSFKTPGLRSVELTAPYMHNGVYKTLEEVIRFYDRGGGAGLGIEVPNQTLPPDKLLLTNEEQKALVSFLKALTDTALVQPDM